MSETSYPNNRSAMQDHGMSRSAARPLGPPAFAWALIFAGILASLYMQYGLSDVQEAKAEMSLDVLRIQSMMLIGLDSLSPGAAAIQIPEIERTCRDQRALQAMACVRTFLSPDDTNAALERVDPTDEFGQELIAAIVDPTLLTEAERKKLKGHLGWFSTLLFAAQAPADDPTRAKIRAAGVKATIGYFSVLGVGGVACLIGFVLLIWGLVAVVAKEIHLRFQPTTLAPLLLEGFALYLFCFVMLQAIGRVLEPPMWAGVLFMLFSFSLGLFWPVLRGLPFAELRQQLGLTRGAGVLREIGCGFVGYIAMLPLFVIGVIMTATLQMVTTAIGWDVAPPTHPAVSWATNGGLWIVLLTFILAAVAAPLTEETMFRGALLHGMRTHLSLVFAGLLMGFIFAIVHPQGWLAIPPLMLLGFGFGLLREWRGSLIAPITAHAMHNGTLVLVMSVLF